MKDSIGIFFFARANEVKALLKYCTAVSYEIFNWTKIFLKRDSPHWKVPLEALP